MSNQINIFIREITDFDINGKRLEETSCGIFICDSYSQAYNNCFINFDDIKKEIDTCCGKSNLCPELKLLKFILKQEIFDVDGTSILEFVYNNKEGLYICEKWFDFKQISPLLKEYFD